MRSAAKHLGTPNVELEELRIWVRGREFPDQDDYWDGNWLDVIVRCGGPASEVWTSGPVLHLSELENWASAVADVYARLTGEAVLQCMEPNLAVKLAVGKRGEVAMQVDITPNHLAERHTYQFEIDQSYLPRLLEACHNVLMTYPIRGRSSNAKQG